MRRLKEDWKVIKFWTIAVILYIVFVFFVSTQAGGIEAIVPLMFPVPIIVFMLLVKTMGFIDNLLKVLGEKSDRIHLVDNKVDDINKEIKGSRVNV